MYIYITYKCYIYMLLYIYIVIYVIYMYNIYYNIYKCVWPFCGIRAQRVKLLFSQLMMSSAWWFDLNMFLKFYHSLSPSRGFESIDPNLTLSKWLLLPWYEGYQELHNGIWSNCPVQPSPSTEFKPRTFESPCANIPIWKIKNKTYEK